VCFARPLGIADYGNFVQPADWMKEEHFEVEGPMESLLPGTRFRLENIWSCSPVAAKYTNDAGALRWDNA